MGCQFLSSSCFLIKFATPYICWSPSPLLVGVPTISSFICGSPRHIHFFFFFLRESPPHIIFNCGSPRHISISIAGVPAHLGLHSFPFHQFHPNLISKDEENSWSFTVINNVILRHHFTRSSSQFNLITIIVHNWLPCIETIQPFNSFLNSNGTYLHQQEYKTPFQ